jgi:CRP/FNR family transcriptional regulator, cyclic AMP receptor protein
MSSAVREDLLSLYLPAVALRRETEGGVVLDSRRTQDHGPAQSAAPEDPGEWDPRAWSAVRLLDVEPDLGAGLSEADRSNANRLVLRALHVPPGQWSPPDALHGAMGILVLAGQLIRTGSTFARPDVQLLGPGDLGECRVLSESQGVWRALEPVQLAVLDDRFVLASRRWPALMTGLAHRLFEAQQREDSLCHLAGRWGHVTTDGVTLTLPVTHALLGALIGARRPTVSLALLALDQQHFLSRRDDRTWLLPADCTSWPKAGIPNSRSPLAA